MIQVLLIRLPVKRQDSSPLKRVQPLTLEQLHSLGPEAAADAFGSTFTFRVEDSGSTTDGSTPLSLEQSLNIEVLGVNDAPVFNTDPATAGNQPAQTLTPPIALLSSVIPSTIEEDSPFSFTSAQLLDGFSDADGDTLSIAGASASYGELSYDQTSDTYNYTPEADFNGTVVIDFAVTDGNGATTIAAKTINITSINDAPALVDANALFLPNIQEDSSLTFSAQELLNAFYDADADPLSIPENSLSLLNTAQGELTGNTTDGWTFTPTADFNGEVTIEFTVSDGNTTDDVTHTVSFNVDAVNDDPTASDWGPQWRGPLLAPSQRIHRSFTAAELLAGFHRCRQSHQRHHNHRHQSRRTR